MKVLDQLTAALGAPILLKPVAFGKESRAAVARWRFHRGTVNVDERDAARVVLCLSGAESVEWKLRDDTSKRRIQAGSVSVMTPRASPQIIVQGPVDVLQVLVEPALIEDLADHDANPLISVFDGLHDQLRRPALQALVAATRENPDDTLLLQSAVHSLAVQLSSAGSERREVARGGLTRAGRRRVEELVSDRLDRMPEVALGLDDLADAAGLSVHHFIKAFRQSVGMTPYAYTLRRSMRLLASPAMSVAEASDRTGFGSPAHFVASFRHHNGITPGAFRAAMLENKTAINRYRVPAETAKIAVA